MNKIDLNNLCGVKWCQLTIEQQEKIFSVSNVDSDNINTETGECIIDVDENTSIRGKIIREPEYEEIIIYNEEVFYNPCE